MGGSLDEPEVRQSGGNSGSTDSADSKRGSRDAKRVVSKNESNSSSGSSPSSSKTGEGGEVTGQNLQSDLSVANQRGSNWALPSKTPSATGYVRPIRLICGADYLEVKSGGVLGGRISLANGTAGAIDPLVEQVWQQIKSWGVAGKNGYWKPQLRVTVLPGGESRFSELNGLLYKSGLLVEELR
jgi:hypothetical protein